MVMFLGYDPHVELLYEKMKEYFQDPVFFKISKSYVDKGVEYDVYAVRIESLLLKDRRFLIAMVRPDPGVPTGSGKKLSELRWWVMQMRSLVEEDPDMDGIPPIKYEIKRELIQDIRLFREDMNDEVTTYRVDPDFPMTVHLLHKKKGPYEYAEEGNLLAAVETYQTLLCLKERNNSDLEKDFFS